MERILKLLLLVPMLFCFGASNGINPQTGSGLGLVHADHVFFDDATTLDDRLGRVRALYDCDGDGSHYETCTGVGSDTFGLCKASGYDVYADAADDIACMLNEQPDLYLKPKCGTAYVFRTCQDFSDPTENLTDADHDSDDDDAHEACPVDEYGTPIYNVAVRGRRLTIDGCGSDERDNQIGNMGSGTDRANGLSVGTTFVNNMGSAFATWFNDGGDFNPVFSTGVQQSGGYVKDFVGRTGTGPVHSSTNGKGKWALGLQEPLWHQIERGSVCACNDATTDACDPIGGTKATDTSKLQTLVAGDRVVIAIPTSDDPTNVRSVTEPITVAGVASADGGRCYYSGSIVSKQSYDSGTRTQINVDTVHQLVTGMRVWIAGTTSYNASGNEDFTIEVIDSDSFVISKAFNAGDTGATGTWTSGSQKLREVYLGQELQYQQGTFSNWGNDSGEAKAVTVNTQNLKTGDYITVSGTEGGVYDGSWPIRWVDSTHIVLTGSTYSVNPAPGKGIYIADAPTGTGGLANGFVDDEDSTAVAFLMHPGQEYWDGYLEISNVTFDMQDPRGESGGRCSDTGQFLIGTGVDTDQDCDTTFYATLYGGTVWLHDLIEKGHHAYAFDGSTDYIRARLGPNLRMMYGHGEATMDQGQGWDIDGWSVERQDFYSAGNIFGTIGAAYRIRHGLISDVFTGQIISIGNNTRVALEDIDVVNSYVKNAVALSCGVNRSRFKNIDLSGMDSGHNKNPSQYVDNTIFKIDCTDSDDPITLNLFEGNKTFPIASHNSSDPNRGRMFLITTGSEAGFFGNAIVGNQMWSESSDSALLVVPGTTPTAAEIATLAIAQTNAYLYNSISPLGSLFGYNKSTSGTPGQPTLTTPIIVNGAGNIEGNAPSSFDQLRGNGGPGGPLATLRAGDVDVAATDTGDEVCAAYGATCAMAMEADGTERACDGTGLVGSASGFFYALCQ